MIRLENVTKTYRTNAGRHTVFRDLNLEIPSGCGMAFLGRNGVGKTTLVNIIGGAEKADSGRIYTSSSVSWPVGLAGGFQPSLTPRENVKFVARLYADKREIRRVVEYVRDFAEIGEYFDMPVRTLSSGMKSRISFGLSMAFDFDYYLIDEVTAVGDPQFRKKCDDLLRKKRALNAGFVVVSHQMGIVRAFCNRAAVLSHDGVRVYDDVESAIKVYHQMDQAAAAAETASMPQQQQPLAMRVTPLVEQRLAGFLFPGGKAWFEPARRLLRARLQIVAAFADVPISQFVLCDSATGVWMPIEAQASASPNLATMHPDLPWGKQSRFVFDLSVNLAARPVHPAIMARCGDDYRPLIHFVFAK